MNMKVIQQVLIIAMIKYIEKYIVVLTILEYIDLYFYTYIITIHAEC